MVERHEGTEPEMLHYYCSSSTLLSIVRSKTVWLTAVTLSNDRMEGSWAVEKYLSLFKSDDRRGQMGARALLEGSIRGRTALAICFSLERDLLSQWRGYAAGGRGVCVSFDTRYLKSAIERKKNDLPKLDLYKIDYFSNLPKDHVRAIHEEFGPQIEQARKGKDGDFISMSKDFGNGGHDRETRLVAQLFAVKNPAFKEEREWRILLVDYPKSISELKFRERNELISPYVEIPIELDAITSVTLGPLHPTPSEDVERMLSTFNVNVAVRNSSASYVIR